MTADCIMINANLQSRNARISKVKEHKKIIISLSRSLQLNNWGQYIQLKQIKKKDRQKYRSVLLGQRLSDTDRNQLLKKGRCFKYYEFEHLVTDCITKKQNVSNVAEKNNTESVTMRKKVSKKWRFSATNNELKNWCSLLKMLTREIVSYLY